MNRLLPALSLISLDISSLSQFAFPAATLLTFYFLFMNIFVGNLSSQATEKQLENLFTPFGEIKSVKIITDSYSSRSKGFAFVEMMERSDAEKAIEKLNNSSLHGQLLTVNEARPKGSRESFGKRDR